MQHCSGATEFKQVKKKILFHNTGKLYETACS